jgi:hypothetical protein
MRDVDSNIKHNVFTIVTCRVSGRSKKKRTSKILELFDGFACGTAVLLLVCTIDASYRLRVIRHDLLEELSYI